MLLIGPYQAVVEDVVDSDKRLRARVRVLGIDYDDTPVNALRLAEMQVSFASKLAGDFPHPEVGDNVWVQFRGGDPNYPVITGYCITESGGLNDVPSDITSNYDRDRKKWLRIDRIGNTLEMSEVDSEQWARLISGAAEVRVSQKDNSVRFFAKSGMVKTEAKHARTEADNIVDFGQTIIISARAFDQLGGGSGLLHLLSNFQIAFHADKSAVGGGVINLGGYVPYLKGTTDSTDPSMDARQTDTVNVLGKTINNGIGPGMTQGNDPVTLWETEQNNVRGQQVLVEAKPSVKGTPGTVRIHINAVSGEVNIESDQKITANAPEVDVTGATKVKVSAPNVEVDATTKVLVSAPQVEVDSPDILLGGP